MQTHVSAPATEAGDASPTQRDWWTATKETWANPAEWSVWQMGILLGLVAILAAAAFWVTRPGG
ncbi:MAG: hypothetical protein ACRDJN_18835, partial [Chloroflexota bacterium]